MLASECVGQGKLQHKQINQQIANRMV